MIPLYLIHEKKEKIFSFLSALILYSGYFWGEATKRNDLYLKTRVVSDILLFGMRLILAHNIKLFPCHKWLVQAVESVDEKPQNILEIANEFLKSPTEETENKFVDSILEFQDWGYNDFSLKLTRFIEDNEQWWWKQRPNIAEW